MLIQSLRSQHAQILVLARKLVEVLNERSKTDAGVRTRTALDRLAVVLVAHLQVEDRELYPRLVVDKNAEVARTAQRFSDEMGGLSAAFLQFDKAWRDPQRIAAELAAFERDWNGIKEALTERIMAEENLLYMLGERALSKAG
jgi:hemerythrin-like domain-containing protein